MNLLRFTFRVVLLAAFGLPLAAQVAPPELSPRVLGTVDDTERVLLGGNAHSLVRAQSFRSGSMAADQGVVEDSLPAGRMLLMLQRSSAQEEALRDFIQAAHTPGSASYHQWLKPREFGRLYGPTDDDVAAVTAWLQSHGLTVNQVHAGRLAIEFSGTAGQVSEAFQTQIHRYQTNGETHLANATAPSVPAALAPVIAGLAPVSDVHPRPNLKVLGAAQFDAKTHQATPQWTYPVTGGVVFVMAPGDFAVQYDIKPVYSNGFTGAGQTIAIISASNVDLSLVQAYQSLFGLTPNLPQVVVDGIDPGINDAATEAYLDLEIAGSVAPAATVLLYTSAGTATTDGLALAAMRAVEDDQASVISTSYGECELQLGQSGNAFWSALWQQAAAQGQTAFVSTGDGGSAGCDNFDAQSEAYYGLAVNGIASTPYNVAVGGTDFYYSSYAGTTTAINNQIATYWTATTTSPTASLKQTIPEQAWNDFFGFNLAGGGNPANLSSQDIVSGSGGASSDAYYPNNTTVGQGYPKPAWQTGTGVPADGVRDLPDVSLFAANGNNYSFYPICANPGDCSSANLTSSGTVAITGVGGTSVSSPAMAAIQALVNQSVGSWQGQADFIYYPLAAKQPTAFHDVTVGGNHVLCYSGTSNCVTGSSATNSTGYSVESGYSAGRGYDLATGLGSIDVAKLIQFWSSIVLTPTATTLSVSPTSLVHGKAASISGTVARSSGSGTPTGAVSLTGNDGVSHYASIDAGSLSAGSFYALVDNLPGGTYQLTASYGGDANFAASKSQPVTVTVTPESNTLAATGWVLNPSDMTLYPLSPGISLPYGAQIYLDAQPVSSNATISGQPTPATGTIAFTDTLGSAVTTSTQPLNASGMAEWSTGIFAPGSHTVAESYSGDPSYNPSTAASAASFTVIQGSTNLTVKPLVTSVAAGSSVAIDVQLNTGYLSLYGTLPTGNVTVKLGSQTVTGTLQPYGSTGTAILEAVVTFTNVPAGVLPVSATYAGDSNWLASVGSGGTVTALASKLTPAVTLTTSLANPAPSQNFTLAVTVAGPSGSATPTGTVTFLSDSQSLKATATLSSGVASLTLPGYALANGTNIFTVVYQGNSTYTTAASNAVNVTVAQSDFSLTAQNAELQISPSGSGVSTLALAPVNGFSGTVTLTSSAPAGITVTPAAASLALSAAATDALTINVAASKAAGIYPLNLTASGGGHIHTAQILVQVLAVAAPLFSPAAGTYSTAQSVTLSSATTGATFYYTTNGTTPTSSSTKYTGAIQVAVSETLQAIAVVSGHAPSSVTSAAYTMTPPAAAPTFAPAAGTYTTAQSITLSSATAGATIYYTTNGTTPTSSSTKYTGAIQVAVTETLQAIATASGFASSPVASAAYTINLPPPVGNLDSAVDSKTGSTTVLQNNSLVVAGWIADQTDGSPLGNVKVYIDGNYFGTPTLGLARADVASYFGKPAYTNSGFSLTASAAALSPGTHAVTVVAIDSGGRSTTFGPLSITVLGGPPVGNLDTAVDSTTGSATIQQNNSLLARGWVADPIDGSPLSNVKVYIDGNLFGTPTLGLSRADVASYLNKPAYTNSGFSLTASVASLAPGTHAVTVVAIDSGGRSSTFGPISITVLGGPPVGNLDTAVDSTTGSATIQQNNSLLARGWVADPIDGSPLSNVKVYIDGNLFGTPTLGLSRADVASYFGKPAYTNSGFSLTASAATLSPGTHAVTVVAIDSGGRSTTFGPLTVTVLGGPPVGNLEAAVDYVTGATAIPQNDSLLVGGFVADPIDGSPLSNVKVYIDGNLFGTPTLGLSRADVASYFGKATYANSGFQLIASAASLSIGTHAVTVVAIDSGGRSSTFGPLSITVTGGPPVGNLDAAVDNTTGKTTVSKSDSLLVSGWIADPVDGSPLGNIKVYIDGSLFGTPTLGRSRADVASYFGKPTYTNSGFQLIASAASLSVGTHSVTVVAIDSGLRSTTFGPLSITVTSP
jgi:subtilase family serine protease